MTSGTAALMQGRRQHIRGFFFLAKTGLETCLFTTPASEEKKRALEAKQLVQHAACEPKPARSAQ